MRAPSPRASSPAHGSANRDHRWVIVLAGGDGTRLAELTRRQSGAVVPKQYCSLHGGRSLLGDALARAAALAPSTQIVTVVAQQHAQHWRAEWPPLPVSQLIVQPGNRGTAPGVLLPLAAVLERDPDAIVTLLPCDHFVADERALTATLQLAQRIAAEAPQQTFLVGIAPDAAEPEYGWIVPDRARATAIDGISLAPVARFVEKPDRALAAMLWAGGAIWNSFLVVARGSALRALMQRRLPHLANAFASAEPQLSPYRASQLYERLAPSDFSRDVLAGAEADLRVLTAPSCGWTDLGTPARVLQCLRRWPLPMRRHRRHVARVDLAARVLAGDAEVAQADGAASR